jgi:GTPase SAR1 family protein
MQNFHKPQKIKIILLGNRSVGKSSIIRRFVLDDFPLDVQV